MSEVDINVYWLLTSLNYSQLQI